MHPLQLPTARWRKSSHSTNNGNCVEIATGTRWAAIRDSKNPDGGALLLGPTQYRNFLRSLKNS
ncbi:DUF397 domain-containing protein [Actinoalloteichus caeruleus]|uniref:DUF397 domain-containing protein n=1 Tax=Actinoalloteichus cyanogriseus TaxID=2893586 RepID=UPI0004AB1FEA|nr:DUF397 domain-containing protein [Actinoalloteichus caeruleus]